MQMIWQAEFPALRKSMKNKSVSGTIKSQWGVTFPTVLEYAGPVSVYSNYDEIVAANDLPNNDEIVRARNASRVANKRGKLVADAIAKAAEAFKAANPNAVNPFVEPTTENSPKVRWTNIYESCLAHNGDKDKSAMIATAALDGYTPEDFDANAE